MFRQDAQVMFRCPNWPHYCRSVPKQMTYFPAEVNACWCEALEQHRLFEGALRKNRGREDSILQSLPALRYLLMHHSQSVFKRQRPARGGMRGEVCYGEENTWKQHKKSFNQGKRASKGNTAWCICFWQKERESKGGKEGDQAEQVERRFRFWWAR